MRAYLVAALLLVVLFGAIGGYLYRQISAAANADYSMPPVTVAADESRLASWAPQIKAVGSLRAARGITLSVQESGEIVELAVRSGDSVKQGQLLLRLNDNVELADLQSAEAALELATILFQRDEKLLKQKSVPQTQYDRSKASLSSAKAQLAAVKARLRNKQLHAPFDGTVGIINVEIGDYIEPGTTVSNLQDLSQLELDFSIPARHVPQLQVGQSLTVTVDAFADRQFNAHISAIDSEVNRDTRNILLRATLDGSPGLLPGMFASVVLSLDDSEEHIVVPQTAVTYSAQGDTVFVIHRDNEQLTVQPVVVKVGDVHEGKVAIRSGLAAGERVVIAGQNKLYRGAAIVVDEKVKF